MEQTIGKRIVFHRKRLGLTQDQLAEKLGVTAQAVSKWENDQSCPDISMLPKLAQIFGITTDALLGSTPDDTVFASEVVSAQEEKDQTLFHDQKGNWEFTWDVGRRGALGFALLVLAVGAQLLIAKILNFDLGFWSALWPTALIVFGLTELTKKFSFLCLGSLLFGGYFLLDRWNLLPFSLDGELVFPAILVIFGLSLLVDALRKPRKPCFHLHHNGEKRNDCRIDGECFECSASFGEAEHFISIPRLTKGKISTNFGDCTVDLSGVGEVSENCSIDAGCSFGDLTILVPRRYQIRQTASTSFAEVEVSGHPDPQPEGIIYIKASASFGEISIRYI